ncbi:hypothetical protein HYS93_02490 [Candidatus Daviesbacteria bacterium]|nr:hypothetical protein [Candidatus Daviesbacteria bacterium]
MGFKVIKDLKLAPVLMILIGVVLRLLPHPPNFAPITAIALFSGVYLPKKFAFVLPISALFISDLSIGFYGLDMISVYGSFLLIGLIGLWLKPHKNPLLIFGATLFSSTLFYLLTNLAVWANPVSTYSKDLTGLLQSYISAIPFYKNTLLGDIFYTATFIGGFELIKKYAKTRLSSKLYKLVF